MVTLTVAEGTGPERLQLALQALVDHHDALRLRFDRTATGWSQVNAGRGERVSLSCVDLSADNEADIEKDRQDCDERHDREKKRSQTKEADKRDDDSGRQ